jgi:hypothetical protein
LVALLVTLFLSSFAWAQDVTFTFEDLPLGDIPPDGVVIARTLPAGDFIPNYDPDNPPADDHIAIRVSRTGPAPARIDEVPDVDGRPEWGSRTLSPFADPFDPSRMVIEILHVSPDGPDERGVEYIAWEMGDFYPSDIDEYEFQTFAAAPAVPESITGGGILGIPPPFPPPLFLATYKWVQRAHPITRFEVVGGSAEPVPEGAPFYPHSLYYDNFVFTVSAVNQFQGTDVPASDFGGEFLSAGLGNTGGDPRPTAKIDDAGPYECGIDVLSGTVSDSSDGDLSYKWVVLLPGGGETDLGEGTVTVLAGVETQLPGETVDLCLGVHTIELRVLDVTALKGDDTADVEVVDTTPPTLDPVSSHSELWPPNHKMVTVTIDANASDNCCGSPTLDVVSVSSDEPVDGRGDGKFVPDWDNIVIDQNAGTITLDLRAERSGKGDGRTYTVLITATDGVGHETEKPVIILVPHDKGKKGKK